MRYATFDVRAHAERGVLLGEALTKPAIGALEAIRQFDRVGDGTATALVEFAPTLPGPERAFDPSATMIDYVTLQTGENVQAFLHFEMPETMETLMCVVQERALVIDYPIEAHDCPGLRMTLVGFQEAVQDAFAELHGAYDLRVECTGAYRGQCNRLLAELTEKQREALEAAVEAGYYEVPRRATHDDVGRLLGRTDATVGEHLRKVEAQVLSELVR